MSILSLFNSTKPEAEVRDYNPAWLKQMSAAIMSANAINSKIEPVPEQQALTVSAVYSAVKLLSEIPASLSIFHQEKKDGYYQTIDSGSIADVLRRPNDFQTSFIFMQSMLTKLHLRGNAYAFIMRDGLKIKYIPISDEHTIEVLVSPKGDEIFYKINGVAFQAFEILHFKVMSLDGYVGLSPIQYAVRTLRNMIDSERFMNKVFESGISASGFFTTTERLTTASFERLKKEIAASSGVDRAGEAKVLDSGLKFERNTLSAVDTQIIEGMSFSVEQISRIYRVPKHLLYLDSKGGSTRSFSTQAREFLTYSLAPLFNSIEEEIAVKTLTTAQFKSGKNRIRFDIKALLRVDPKERSDYYKGMFNVGSVTPNEIRAEEDLPPIDGGDTTYIPLNLAPINLIDQIITDKINKQIDSTN